MQSSLERDFGGVKSLGREVWLRLLRTIESRLSSVEKKKADFEAAEKQVLSVAFDRLDETLTPAIEAVLEIQERGFLIARSSTPATMVEGNILELNVGDVNERRLFTPSPFTLLSRQATAADYALLRTVGFDNDSGQYLAEVVSVVGDPGPHNDWVIGALAGSTIGQIDMLHESRDIRDAVAADRTVVGTDRTAVGNMRSEVQGWRNEVSTIHGEMKAIYRGALPAPPAGGRMGDWYFDISDRVVKVFNGSTWAPSFVASIAGFRGDDYIALPGQKVFTLDGGFTHIDVYRNGIKLTAGVDYDAASPSFTMTTALAGGEKISARGFLSNDAADFYRKAEMNAFLAARDNLIAAKANNDSPNLTGTPRAPTAPVGTNSDQIATMAAVRQAIDALVNGAGASLDTLRELSAALNNDPNFGANIVNLIGTKAARNGDLGQQFQASTFLFGSAYPNGPGGRNYIGADGNIWMGWANDWLSNVLASKQPAGSYASLNGNAGQNFYAAGMIANDFHINGWGWLTQLLNAKQPAGNYAAAGGNYSIGFAASAFYTDRSTATGSRLERNDGVCLYLRRYGSGGGPVLSFEYGSNGVTGSIHVNASVVTYATTSDGRLKPIREDFDPDEILDGTTVVRHNWLSDPDAWSYGVIAQDEVERFPQAVTRGNDLEPGEEDFEPWGVDYAKYVPLLIRGRQNDRKRIAALEAQNEALERRLAALEARSV